MLILILFTGVLYFGINAYFKRKKGRVNFYADTVIPVLFIVLGVIPTIATIFIVGSMQIQLSALYLCWAIAFISLVFTLIKIIKLTQKQKPSV